MAHPDYTLYYHPGSARMLVHLALLEIGVPYRLVEIDFASKAQHAQDYRGINPMGVVPTLVIDGKPLMESAALLLILAERHPQAGLAPLAGSAARDEWHQWVVHLSTTLGAAFRLWFYPGDLAAGPAAAGAAPPDPAIRGALQSRIEQAWDRLDAHLRARGPYLLGEEFSGVDLQATMLMRWSRRMPKPATDWPALRALADLVRERRSWKRLYELEGLDEWYAGEAEER